MENVVFIILAILFFAILFVFVYRQASGTSLIEERTAKQIALAIDAADKDTQIVIDLRDVYGKKNKDFQGNFVSIDNTNKFVKVQLGVKSGYDYGFFNNVNVVYKTEGGVVTLIIK